MSYLENIGLEDEIKIMKMMEYNENKDGKLVPNVPVSGHEVYNVDVPSGRVSKPKTNLLIFQFSHSDLLENIHRRIQRATQKVEKQEETH